MADQPQPDKQSDKPVVPETSEAKDKVPAAAPVPPATSSVSEKPAADTPAGSAPEKPAADTPAGSAPEKPAGAAPTAPAPEPAVKPVAEQPATSIEGVITRDVTDMMAKDAPAPASAAPPPSALISKPSPPSAAPTTTAPKPAAPAPAATAPTGTVCPSCAHRNRPGVLICENCGTSLVGRQVAVGTRDLKRDEEARAADGERLLDTGQAKAVEMAGGSAFTEAMVLRIEIEGGATPMLVYPKQEIIVGRRDPNTGGMPDVDLTAYAGYRMGVSRRHAAIRLQDRHLHVSDLGSSNGTFLNGTRLVAHRPYQLRDGDEVRLGQMVMKLFFQANKGGK